MSFIYIGSSVRSFTSTPKHIHPNWEIIITTEGEGTSYIAEKEAPFHPGSIEIVPPNTYHIKKSSQGFRDIYLHTDSITPKEMPDADHTPFFLEDDAEGSLGQLMKMLLYRYVTANKSDTALILMHELIIELIHEKISDHQFDTVIESIRRQMVLNFTDPKLSITALLEKTGYQKDYVRRKFTSVCGISPGEYLASLRIENAKRLLVNRRKKELSISEISRMCGYSDSHYFSRAFKKQVGISPESYEKITEDIH
jgi:AraC-like DNA-binding protein